MAPRRSRHALRARVQEPPRREVLHQGRLDGARRHEVRPAPPCARSWSHTAGFGYGLAEEHPVDKLLPPEDEVLSSIQPEADGRPHRATIPLMFQPGTNWSYSASVDIQGYIVEKLSGQTLGAVHGGVPLFAPLKMPDTAFYTGPDKSQPPRRRVPVYDRDTSQRSSRAKQLFGIADARLHQAARSWNPAAAAWSPPRWTTPASARCSPTAANSTASRILAPATVELMGTNVIPKNVLVNSNNGTGVATLQRSRRLRPRLPGRHRRPRLGLAARRRLDQLGRRCWHVVLGRSLERPDLRRHDPAPWAGTGGDDLGTMARTLTYQALVHPESRPAGSP